MVDFFVLAARPTPTAKELFDTEGCMLGSIDWDSTALLGEILTGTNWSYDHLEWAEPRGETQVGRIPQPFTLALAGVRDEQVAGLAAAWLDSLVAESPGPRWAGARTTLEQDLIGLREEASRAVSLDGSLWLRIEL
jgi:hypothetical protein